MHTLNAVLSTLHPLAEELSFAADNNFIFDLSHLGILDVNGEAAPLFLQGQLSCDVREISATQMRPGALCNLKGRILALVDVLLWQNFHLILPKDLLAATQTSLAKAALLSRVHLDSSDRYAVLGVYVQNPATLPAILGVSDLKPWGVQQSKDRCSYAISPHLWIVLVRDRLSLWESFSTAQRRGSLAWHALALQAQRYSIYPHTRGMFLPHRLELQHTPCVSFNKGCYKGQEIIARTHYRATPKHAVKLYTISSTEPLLAGQKIFDATQKTAWGELIDYCPLGENRSLIVSSMLFDHPTIVRFENHSQAVHLVDQPVSV